MLELMVLGLVILLVTGLCGLVISVIKKFLHDFFDYVPDQRVYWSYVIYYTISLFVFFVLLFWILPDIGQGLLMFSLVIVGEVIVFYKKYYDFHGVWKYTLYLLSSNFVGFIVVEMTFWFAATVLLGVFGAVVGVV